MTSSTLPTVLVVEDDQLILLNSRLVLENAGYCVLSAEDAGEALAVLDDHPEVSMLLTDIAMPGPIDGLELASRVFQLRPDLPVIVISGQTKVDGDDLPPSARFLAKPYTARHLIELLASVRRGDPA